MASDAATCCLVPGMRVNEIDAIGRVAEAVFPCGNVHVLVVVRVS